MRLNVHDYSGHPFQVQLSRELAARGHEVLHGFSTQYVTGHGRLEVDDQDPATLRIEGVTCGVPMIKYSPVGRTRFELSYAKAWQRDLDAQDPFDLVVACNVPMFTLARMRRYFAARRQPWVLWHQDLYSLGVGGEAARRLPGPLAGIAQRRFEDMERRQVLSADAVIAITDAMTERYRVWGIQRDGVTVQTNWAPLDHITPRPRDNEWALRHGLAPGAFRLVYAGTLGRKHNPLLLLELLDGLRARGVEAQLVVASEGAGVEYLQEQAGDRPDLLCLGFQPADEFPDMLGSADVVVAILEESAAKFSVPSKVHSYLSAGRPVVALVPDGNPAATEVRATGGFVAAPTTDGAVEAAGWLCELASDGARATQIGTAARQFAEEHFDVCSIADNFEAVFRSVLAEPEPASASAPSQDPDPRIFDQAAV